MLSTTSIGTLRRRTQAIKCQYRDTLRPPLRLLGLSLPRLQLFEPSSHASFSSSLRTCHTNEVSPVLRLFPHPSPHSLVVYCLPSREACVSISIDATFIHSVYRRSPSPVQSATRHTPPMPPRHESRPPSRATLTEPRRTDATSR